MSQTTGPQTVSTASHLVPAPDLWLRCDQPIPPAQTPERYALDNAFESLTLREVAMDSICPSHYSLLREWGVAGPGGSLDVKARQRIEGSCDIVHYLSATDSAGNTGTGSVRFTFENCCDMPSDMNDDGIVGSSDLLLLLAAFGSTCQ